MSDIAKMEQQDTTPTASMEEEPASPQSPLRQLPADLPTSLDDRRDWSGYERETEMYDGWQGRINSHPIHP
jgi:hypothetical protein